MKRISTYNCFEVLGNKLRFEIIQLLRTEELPVLGIAEKLKAEQSRVSHALQILKDCRLVATKRKGKQKIYFVPNEVNVLFDFKQAKKHNAENVFDILSIHSSAYCGNCHREKQKG